MINQPFVVPGYMRTVLLTHSVPIVPVEDILKSSPWDAKVEYCTIIRDRQKRFAFHECINGHYPGVYIFWRR